MIKKRAFFSLKAKTILVTIISIVTAFVIYGFAMQIIDYYMYTYYLEDGALYERNAEIAEKFQKFIDKNNISTDNGSDIKDWVVEFKNVYLIVYDNKKPIFLANRWLYDPNPSSEDGIADYYTQFSDCLFEINYADGTYETSIYDTSYENYSDIINRIMLILAAIFVVTIMLIFTYRITRRISNLSDEVKIIEKGNLDIEIKSEGRDEIGELSQNLDFMRKSLLERMENEQIAWQANRELITSISHDIRTPLTSIIGYVDLIEKAQYESQEEFEEYTRTLKKKALQLKRLTDELFRYFYVFGENEISFNIENFNGEIIMEQILAEKIFALNNAGFEVDYLDKVKDVMISADADYLNRVFDNIFDNIKKYGDTSKKVEIRGYKKNNYCVIKIMNWVNKENLKVESTKIGIKTCTKIMEQMKGGLDIEQNEDVYSINVSIPIAK